MDCLKYSVVVGWLFGLCSGIFIGGSVDHVTCDVIVYML